MMDLQTQLQGIRELDDESLLRSLKRHVGSANRLNALVLAHLAEVDARSAYRLWACETLFAYCVYELRLSEDEAQRRCRAARVMRQFPVLFEMVADASIHLTGILLIGPYLTADNHMGLLARARFRSERELERLVAEIARARDVPALVEPLGVVTGARTIPRTSWAALTESTLGWVRQIPPGDGAARAPNSPDDVHAALVASSTPSPTRARRSTKQLRRTLMRAPARRSTARRPRRRGSSRPMRSARRNRHFDTRCNSLPTRLMWTCWRRRALCSGTPAPEVWRADPRWG